MYNEDLTEEEMVELASEATIDLLDWFEAHENDISLGFKDYGRLRTAFQWFVGRLPSPTEVH